MCVLRILQSETNVSESDILGELQLLNPILWIKKRVAEAVEMILQNHVFWSEYAFECSRILTSMYQGSVDFQPATLQVLRHGPGQTTTGALPLYFHLSSHGEGDAGIPYPMFRSSLPVIQRLLS